MLLGPFKKISKSRKNELVKGSKSYSQVYGHIYTGKGFVWKEGINLIIPDQEKA